jgi:hypothetical protein
MTENAFARAAAATSGQGAQPATDQLTGNAEGYDPLFGGGKSLPSLFVKSHGPGAELTGIVTDVPFQKHSRTFMRDGSLGALKYWGDDNKPTETPVDAAGQPRRPVMDQVFPLQTEYRDRGPADRPDDGARAWYLSNKYAMEAAKKAIADAGITSREQIKGMRLTVIRDGEEGKWDYIAKLTRP